MASEVDICNIALSHLGDSATVASIDPPEGSAQAEHCARFYPIARDALLEAHTWAFATKRVVLAELVNTWSQWKYAYARPSDCAKAIAVLAKDAAADYQTCTQWPYPTAPMEVGAMFSVDSPQPFACEINDTGAQVVYTNQEDAMLRYVARVTDTTRFSYTFTMALTWSLASMLAGPIIKGEVGRTEAQRCAQFAAQWLSQAKLHDAQQQKVDVTQNVAWIAGR